MKAYIPVFIFLLGWITSAYGLDMVIQDGHKAEVTAVQVDVNGQYLVSGSNDAAVKLWSLVTGKLLRTFTGHGDAITAVAINQPGTYAASGSKDKTIRIWDLQTGKPGKTIDCPAVPLQVLFDFTGKQIISSHQDNKIRTWNLNSAALAGTVTVESGKETLYQSIRIPAADPGTGFTACTGTTGDEADNKTSAIHIIDQQSGKQIAALKGHTDTINALAIDRAGNFMFSAGEDKTLKVWDCKQWVLVKTITGFKTAVKTLAADSRGEWATAAESNGVVSIVDIIAGKILGSFESGAGGINQLVISPDDRFIITAEADKSIKIRDRVSGYPDKILEGNVDKYLALAVLPGKKRLATGMDTGEIKIWDLTTGYLVSVLAGHTGAVKALVVNSRNNTLVSAGSDTTIKTWDLDKGIPISTFTGHTKDVNSLSIDRNGKYLASGSDDESIKIWEIQTGKLIKTINNFMWVFGPVDQPQYIARGNAVLPETPGEKQANQQAAARGRYWINAVCFDTGSDDLISAGYDGVKIWNVETSRVKNTLFSGFNPVNAVTFDPARKYTVSGDIKGQIVIWKFSSPTVVKKIAAAHTGAVTRLAVSADGLNIFSAGEDNMVKVWRIKDGEPAASIPVSAVNDFTILDEKGDFLLSAGNDGSLVYSNREEQLKLTWLTRGKEWLIYSPEGYFNCTGRGIGLAGIAYPPQVAGLEPASLKYNRPDLILERLYEKNQPYIDYYAALYRERLSRMMLTEEQLQPAALLPAPVIREAVHNGKFLDLIFTLELVKHDFTLYNIVLNGVPIYPLPGKVIGEVIKAQAAEKSPEEGPALPQPAEENVVNTMDIKERITLAAGVNKVELFCIDAGGVQSLKSSYTAAYSEPADASLYFIGFGISLYKDQALNVKFSQQDVKDTADYLNALAAPYKRKLVKTFFDSGLELDALQKAKEFIATAREAAVKAESAAAADKQAKADATAASKKLEKSKQKAAYDKTYKSVYDTTYKQLYDSAVKVPSADDTIILYLNGRMYRNDALVPAAYFCPYSVNRSDITNTALNIQALADLLEIPGVCNKLLIKDLANAAEVNAEVRAAALLLPADIKPRLTIADNPDAADSGIARAYLGDTDLFFFSNPLFNTGIIELASGSQGELSLESNKMKNGLFTEHLLGALSGKTTDLDGDGQLSMNEIYTALYAPVVKDSGGLQHPVLLGAEINPWFRLPAGKAK